MAFSGSAGHEADRCKRTNGAWIRAQDHGEIIRRCQDGTDGHRRDRGADAFPPRSRTSYLSLHRRRLLRSFQSILIAKSGLGFRDGTESVRFAGTGFEPFTENPDRTPTVYLGFDGELPVAALGLYFEIDTPLEEPTHEFRWEHFDGRDWVSLPVEDETAHLTRTGIVRVVWPGNPPLRRASPVAASGDTATALISQEASLFVVGEKLHLKENEVGELATVGSIAGG